MAEIIPPRLIYGFGPLYNETHIDLVRVKLSLHILTYSQGGRTDSYFVIYTYAYISGSVLIWKITAIYQKYLNDNMLRNLVRNSMKNRRDFN